LNINDHIIMSLFFYTDLERLIPGDVALISQSGTVPLISLARSHERGIGYRCLIAVGNEADIEISDFIGYMVDDAQTRAIAGYVEGFKNVKKFMQVADLALAKKKPIILLHATRFERSLTAAKYHTGAYTEPGYEFEAIFKEKCVITVDEPEELIEFGNLFSFCKIPVIGDRIGILNTTGGVTVLTADISEELGLDLPDFSMETRAMLTQWLKFGTVNNPMDLTGQVAAEPGMYGNVLEAFVKDKNFDILVVSIYTLWREPMEYRVNKIIELSKGTDKPIIILWPGSDIGGDLARRLTDHRVPVFRTFRSCLKGTKALIRYSQFLNRWRI
jgi:acetyltransferase